MSTTQRRLINLLLLVAIVGLTLLLVYQPGKSPVAKPVTISSVSKQAIGKIQIIRQGQADILLQKKDKYWYMLQPYTTFANGFKVNSLLELLDSESIAQYDLLTLDKKNFGLDKAKASIIFNDQHRFNFGATEPLQHRRYVEYNNTLHLIFDRFYYQLAGHATNFIDHALLPRDKNISALELPRLSVKMHDGTWQLSPKPVDFSMDQVTALLDNWKYAQAIELLPLNTKPATDKRIRIWRAAANEAPIEFYILPRGPDLFLARIDLGLIYKLNEEQHQNLLQLPPKLTLPDEDNTAPTEQRAK